VTALVALPIPSKVICEMLGVPYSDHDFFQGRAATVVDAESGDIMASAMGDLFGYLTEMVRAREAEPRDDLISHLAVEQRDGLADLVEELLRYHSIAANAVWRVAAEDVRIGDLQFQAGQGRWSLSTDG
jgi:cytochrome P450